MGNPMLDTAIEGLRLAGIPVPPVSFVEMLINEGEDVLSVIPRLVTTIEALGGEAVSMLEEIAYGMAQYGPVAYAQRLIDQQFEPARQTIRTIHASKAALADTHRTLFTGATTQLTILAPQSAATGQTMAFTGDAANNMHARFTDISAQASRLLTVMDQSQQIDQDLQMQLQIVAKVGMGMAIADLALLAIGLLLAPVTAGASLAISGIVDTGLLAGEAEVLLGAIIACFIVWAARHALLAISTSLAQTHTQSVSTNPAPLGVTINQARAHQGDLPTGGDRPYIPPDKARGDPSKAWDNTQKGFKDADGNAWVWAPAGAQHGGPHWDVQHPDGSHTNVSPTGVIIGKDNFPNKKRKK